MAYGKLIFRAVYSKNEDYTEADRDTVGWPPFELSALTRCSFRRQSIPTTAVALSFLAAYPIVASSAFLVFKNLDATNYILVKWYSNGGGATMQSARVPAGGLLVIPDFHLTSTTITAQAVGGACVALMAYGGIEA